MNSPQPEIQSPKKRGLKAARNRSGLALIIVLEMLVLVVLLVIAFLSSVSIELNSAKQYSSGVDARSLADSAVNLVIAQIQDATTTPQLAWASQPGMVRTYDSDGQPVTAYKLYSSSPLRVDGGFDARANQAAEVPADWASQAALYTDLNQPVAVDGVNHYPIIDPSAVAASVSGGTVLEGDDPPIEGAYLDVNNPAVTVSGSQTNRVPMPVQWMYILADGKLAAMTPGTTTVANATNANPIVGRVAFWADDETAKVNINTASEGSYWDRPYADGNATSGFERLLSTNMPVAGEYQRYPGHPAMTSLSTVFPPLVGEPDVAYRERIYSIIPRINGGGSLGGTVKIDGNALPIIPDAQRLYASVDEMMFQGTFPGGGPRAVNVKGTGNQFSQDDLDRTRFFLTASSRAPEVNMFNKPRIALWPLQANTNDVSSPGTATERNATDRLIAFCSTVGGTPYYFQRFNTFDRSLGRSDSAQPFNPSQSPIPSSQSPDMDWEEVPRNRELFAYLQELTSQPIPGLGGVLGGPGAAKYNVPVRDQILTSMMDYIRSGLNTFSTKTNPAYTFAPFPIDTKGWVTGQSQITPLVIQPPGSTTTTKGFGRISTITQASLVFYRKDKLTYTPNPESGERQVLGDSGTIPGPILVHDLPTADATPEIGAVLLLQTFNPTPGAPPWSGNVRYVVEGLSNFSLNENTIDMDFPDPAVNLVTAQEGYYDATALSGFELATNYWPKNRKKLGIMPPGAPDEETVYPFFTPTLRVPGDSFKFSGGNIRIKIYQGYANTLNSKDLVQTINMNFPDATLPIPNVVFSTSFKNGVTSYTTRNQYTDFDVRLAHPGVDQGGQHNNKPLINTNNERPPYGTRGDVVRSVQARFEGPTRGDFRMIAGLAEVPDSYFEGHGIKDSITDGNKSIVGYGGTARVVHSLRSYVSVGNEQTGKKNGFFQGSGLTDPTRFKHAKLVEAAEVLDENPSGGWRPNRSPVAPQGMKGAYMDQGETILGDWDTGPGTQIDGPYINKADEGNSNIGYYNTGANTTAGVIIETGASFAPNRQIASAVTFGSLPSGLNPASPDSVEPWRTLLFTKHPAAEDKHPGFGKPLSGPPYTEPPDHAFLDLFTMPIVEPYAISEPFSTAGKVNMNYEMVPFTYMKRSTAVRAVLKSAKMMAIPTGAGRNYKSGSNVDSTSNPLTPPPDFRYHINPDELTGTLAGFEQRFASGDIFRSASEICDISLVPGNRTDGEAPAGNPTYANMSNWWQGATIKSVDGYKLTGDNVRENPYNSIYPRLTTKSNTYTIHVRAQALQKAKGTGANQFVEGRDQVTSEYRGSFLVERYLDPNSDTLVKADGKTPADELDADAMVGPYKFRTVSTKRFAP